MPFSELLTRRVATDGARPLITWYGADGARTELSAISFANWVDKTANLLVDALGLDPGEEVALPVARHHPGHWMTLVWCAAIWRAGLCVDLRPDTVARVDVVGPELDVTGAADHLACSLHPLGLGFATALPDNVVDYAAEVKIEPDAYLGPAADPQAPAWRDDDRTLSQTELLEVRPVADRVLVLADQPWPTVRDALLRPLRGGGSAVVATGLDTDRLDTVAAAEHATPLAR